MFVASAGTAAADPVPFRTVDELAKALPSGWAIERGKGTLAIRYKGAVRGTGVQFWTAYSTNIPQPAASPDAPKLTLRLQFRVEPRWTEEQYDRARAANAILYRALVELREKHPTDDADYRAHYANLMTKLVQQPRCTLGNLSVFDHEHTYEQLGLSVEPASAMREAFAIVELVKRRCR